MTRHENLFGARAGPSAPVLDTRQRFSYATSVLVNPIEDTNALASPLVVEVARGALVEAVHRGSIAVVDASGALHASIGDPSRTWTYWRSAAKPFQSLAVVSSGAAARWGFSSEELAVVSGSHGGGPSHVSLVSTLLDRIGVDVKELTCGAHAPLDPRAAGELLAGGNEPSALHNNCSGKHAGMLALARHLGAKTNGYAEAGHPVQQAMLAAVARCTGLREVSISIGVDGCGVPCFGTSRFHLALAFARLMDETFLEEPEASAARVIRGAMLAHPELVAGPNRLDTELMSVGGGTCLAKGGASGVSCVGLAGGFGLAVKIEDGADFVPGRPSGVAALEALRQLGVLEPSSVDSLREHARPEIRTVAGARVGEARPAFTLTHCSGSVEGLFARRVVRETVASSRATKHRTQDT